MSWDYLIVTAANAEQAEAYREQLDVRRRLGLLSAFRQVRVVADPNGRRVGSGGSTIGCLWEIQAAERPSARGEGQGEVFAGLRVLIVHAGGDSRRLPAYGPCGKIFVPLPCDSDSALASTLFDYQLPIYSALPCPDPDRGQIVITSGDVLLDFDPAQAQLAPQGFSGLGCRAAPEQAARHGVYCLDRDLRLRRFLQKPSIDQQREQSAIDRYGESVLDIGVIQFDGETAQRLIGLVASGGWQGASGEGPTARESLAASGERRAVSGDGSERLAESPAIASSFSPPAARSSPLELHLSQLSLDFYREICCALGSETTWEDYLAAVRGAGSPWPEPALREIYDAISPIPASACILRDCGFLHFGTTRELCSSGQRLATRTRRVGQPQPCLSINNQLLEIPAGKHASDRSDRSPPPRTAEIASAGEAWIEGCRLQQDVRLGGQNVLVGVDVADPIQLPPATCLDVLPGRNRRGEAVHFVRCYHADDALHNAPPEAATLSGMPLDRWLNAARQTGSARDVDSRIWDPALPSAARIAWNARLFPAEADPQGYRRWLWMLQPESAGPDQFRAWAEADRYSLEEMLQLADRPRFHARRHAAREAEIRRSLRRCFRLDSGFSAADLAFLLERSRDRAAWLDELLREARWQAAHADRANAEQAFVLSRILHSAASAVSEAAGAAAGVQSWAVGERVGAGGRASQGPAVGLGETGPRGGRPVKFAAALGGAADCLRHAGLEIAAETRVGEWAERARKAAFDHLRRQIMSSSAELPRPQSALRADEIVWGRAPARLDLAGGWTDTPPYALEHGGCVLNAAVLLNGQPPIQAYARVTPERCIRLRSIDVGSAAEIRDWAGLLDYRQATSEFALVKAALAISGFAPPTDASIADAEVDLAEAARGSAATLEETLDRFGGGLELTTLAAIPKGSGLGTSSIMGAVLLAVIHRVLGHALSSTELFHGVLRLEQALTTGGGWQDQIGGALGGLKLITTRPGMVPEATVRYFPPDVLDPVLNGGQTLLYYTGITRLAKNILEQVVGRYLDRDRQAVATLRSLDQLARQAAETVTRKDFTAFGRAIDRAWQLNRELDANSTNDQVDRLLARVRPHLRGAKLLGAGGGGFLLMVCRSPADAAAIRRLLEADPPNDRARFFDFAVAHGGLEVTVS